MKIRKSSRPLIGLCIAALLGLSATSASAVVIGFSPASQNAMPGDSVSLDLIISGLGDGLAPSLGDFDLDIGFDSTALTFLGYTLGTSLGDVGLGDAIDFSFGDLGGGLINLAEVSLLEPDAATCLFCIGPYLDDIQADTFTLATLNFAVDVLDPGTSTTVFVDTLYALGDGFGLPLEIDSIRDGIIRNPRTDVPLPEPATLPLMLLGLLGVFSVRRRHAGVAAEK